MVLFRDSIACLIGVSLLAESLTASACILTVSALAVPESKSPGLT